jgi:hypothetical protein
MDEVYSLMWPQDSEGGVARKESGWGPPKLSERALLSEWVTPTFALDGQFVDLQPNNAGVLILSARMHALIDGHKSTLDRMEWLPIRVERSGEVREYAMPHFIEEVDAIDRRRSVLNRVTGDVIKAHLRRDLIDGHRVFTYSRRTSLIMLLTREVFEAVRDCTGCYFSKIKVSAPEAQA